MEVLTIDTKAKKAPTRDFPASKNLPANLPDAKSIQTHPHPTEQGGKGGEASLFFVGTATTILQWEGLCMMTDPNFLHAGDHVHLGPGVTGTRKTNPAVDLHDLPHIDFVLLSHYHADHFDQEVEASLRRDLPIITTPHAKLNLGPAKKGDDGEAFTAVYALDFWDTMMVDVGTDFPAKIPRIKVTGMPGKHVGDGMLALANEFVKAVPPTNGWMVELGYGKAEAGGEGGDFECGYRIYISGDTLFVSELAAIPEKYSHAGKPIDLMLIHLGGTTVPGPSLPLLMITMDAKQGIELIKLIQPDVTIPIHYDDYDVFLSGLDDFKEEVQKVGLTEKVVYLDRGDAYHFNVGGGGEGR